MSWAARLVILLACFAAGGAAGIKWQIGQQARIELAAAELRASDARQQRLLGDKAARSHEADKVQIRTQIKTIFKEVERVVEKPIYRDTICFDDDGLRIIRAALGSAPAASEPAPAVP